MTTLLTSANISANISAYISQRSGESDDAGNDRVLYKEMNWALANEELTNGQWSRIQPLVDVQDERLQYLSTDLY